MALGSVGFSPHEYIRRVDRLKLPGTDVFRSSCSHHENSMQNREGNLSRWSHVLAPRELTPVEVESRHAARQAPAALTVGFSPHEHIRRVARFRRPGTSAFGPFCSHHENSMQIRAGNVSRWSHVLAPRESASVGRDPQSPRRTVAWMRPYGSVVGMKISRSFDRPKGARSASQ